MLLMLATIQAATYGPANVGPASPDLARPFVAKGCGQTTADEIVVCKKSDIVTNQRITPIQPLPEHALSFDSQGMFKLKLGKNSELAGGGAKGSVGATFRLHF